MKLADLNPRWVSYGGEGVTDAQGNPVPEREGVAVSFDCPCGSCGERAILMLTNPLDGGPMIEPDRPHWQRTGDKFDVMTLTPSIQRLGGCRWHGFVTNGEIVKA